MKLLAHTQVEADNAVPFIAALVLLSDGKEGVRFYDARYNHSSVKDDIAGQFIAEYYADTIKAHVGGLDLHGGVKDWKIDAGTMSLIKGRLFPSAPKAQHTPGPWKLDCENLPHGPKPTLITYRGVPIAKALDNCDSVEETYDNARLIAAAPTLLEALENLLATTELNLDEMENSTVQAIEDAKAAIARATGR